MTTKQTKSALEAIPQQAADNELDVTPVTFLSGKGNRQKVGFGIRIKGNWTTLNVAQLKTLERLLGVEAVAPLAEAMVAAYQMSQRSGELERLRKEKADKAAAKAAGASGNAQPSQAGSALDDIPADA